MPLFKKLFGSEKSIQDQVDAISAEQEARQAQRRSRETEDVYASPFESDQRAQASSPQIDEAPDGLPGGLTVMSGLGGLLSSLKSGELFYGQLDRMAADLTPEERLEAATNGLNSLPPETVSELARRLGTAPDVAAVANVIATGLGTEGGIEALARQLAPNAVGPDGSFSFFTAVKDPVVQEGLKSLFPAFAQVRNRGAES